MSGDTTDGNMVGKGGELRSPQLPFSLSRDDLVDEAGEWLPPVDPADGPAERQAPRANTGSKRKTQATCNNNTTKDELCG